ncbi:MAG: SH3 domain-containing protein [Stellaceae bacterium]
MWVAGAAPIAHAYSNEPLTLPRFESLRWGKVNLRAGPGKQYPIRWVLTRKGMPVEVIETYDVWRKIRDWQGSIGWVHERMLIGNRTIIITGGERSLRATPNRTAPVVARAEVGVVGKLLKCQGIWCRIDARGYKGWLERGAFFGVFPQEHFN